METAETSGDVETTNAQPVEPKEDSVNDAGDAATPSPKKAKIEENTSEKKGRRSSGRKNRCDIEMMEEAKAAYGELVATEGRSLRKRPEPPKVEKATPPPKSTRGRKSGTTPNSKKGASKAEKANDETEAKPEAETSETAESTEGSRADEKPTAEEDGVKESDEKAAEEKPIEPEPEKPEPEKPVEMPAAEPEVKNSLEETPTAKDEIPASEPPKPEAPAASE